MKRLILSIVFIFAIGIPCRADSVTPDLSDARKRYETAISAATKPIRDRYVEELQQLKSRALSLKQLDTANAIEKEIEVVAPKDSTSETLCANIWTLRGDKLEFRRDGILIQRGKGWIGKDWHVSDDGSQVTIRFTNGNGGTFKFENGIMTHFDGTPFRSTPKQ